MFNRKEKQNIEWFVKSDPYQYYDHGKLSDDVPSELREPIQKLSERIEDYYLEYTFQKQMEYNALQSRINPHFLYNTLDAVRSQALEIGATEIEEMIRCISNFFRYSISLRGNIVPLREEINNINDYFTIQKYRFEDRFELEIDGTTPEILASYVPKLILQPIVENSIIHGLEMKKGKGKVKIHFSQSADDIYIRVTDNGIGIPQDKLEKINENLHQTKRDKDNAGFSSYHKGALLNVNARIHLYCGDYYGLSVHSVQNIGTDIDIIIPKISESELENYSLADKK